MPNASIDFRQRHKRRPEEFSPSGLQYAPGSKGSKGRNPTDLSGALPARLPGTEDSDSLHLQANDSMREVITEKLWIGNAFDARDISGVLDLGIAAIVDLAMEELPIQFPRDVVYCRFPLIDGAGNQPAVLRTAIETIASFMVKQRGGRNAHPKTTYTLSPTNEL